MFFDRAKSKPSREGFSPCLHTLSTQAFKTAQFLRALELDAPPPALAANMPIVNAAAIAVAQKKKKAAMEREKKKQHAAAKRKIDAFFDKCAGDGPRARERRARGGARRRDLGDAR